MPILTAAQIITQLKEKDMNKKFNQPLEHALFLENLIVSFDKLTIQEQKDLLKEVPSVNILEGFLKYHRQNSKKVTAAQNIQNEMSNRHQTLYKKLSSLIVNKKEADVSLFDLTLLSGKEQADLLRQMQMVTVEKLLETFSKQDRKQQDVMLNVNLLSEVERRHKLKSTLNPTQTNQTQPVPRKNPEKRAAIHLPHPSKLPGANPSVNGLKSQLPNAVNYSEPLKTNTPMAATVVIPKMKLTYDDHLKLEKFLQDFGKLQSELISEKNAPINPLSVALNKLNGLYFEVMKKHQMNGVTENDVKEFKSSLQDAIEKLNAQPKKPLLKMFNKDESLSRKLTIILEKHKDFLLKFDSKAKIVPFRRKE